MNQNHFNIFAEDAWAPRRITAVATTIDFLDMDNCKCLMRHLHSNLIVNSTAVHGVAIADVGRHWFAHNIGMKC